ncbi:hypothetical protein LCGC14_0438830 [marine sediment metagenome]|uniref:Transmembrane protein n=1 Tax=marine sediment metagenome TaxID=412755 RepID=A0A0F9SKR3_9ZZZZ
MNKRGQKAVFGFSLLIVLFLLIIAAFATIEPFKETLDDVRDTTSLNCPGTLTFNQTDYDDDNSLEKLTRRPTCFVTGISMVYFIGAFVIASIMWLTTNWRKIAG